MFRPDLLTHPNVPKPLHGLTPRTILGDAWWNQVRQEAYRGYDYRCWACGVHKQDARYHQWLEAHEAYQYDYAHGRAELDEIVALCHTCHNFIHNGRLVVLLEKGELPPEKFIDVMHCGFMTLKRTGLRPSLDSLQAAIRGFDWICTQTQLKTPDYHENLREILEKRVQEAKASKPLPRPVWGDWRLIIDGVEYEPLWKTREAWLSHYYPA